VCFYSPDRSGAHPQAHLAFWIGLMQAAYAGFNRLYEPTRLTWTEDGLLRAVSYQGQRTDKSARQVVQSLPSLQS